MSQKENKPDVNLPKMLKYESEMFKKVVDTDSLLVTARGINIETLLTNLLYVFCDPGNLVIVMNHTDYEEKYYSDIFKDHAHCSTHDAADREERYLMGGIHFVTTRILVVDLLKRRIPIEKITGIVVLRAHTILESCQEAFALRLYRQSNKTGFVKAFSSCVESFLYGFGHVERIMRALFVVELFLYPRFEAVVKETLESNMDKASVCELHIPISETVRQMQTCLIELMNFTINELKRVNKYLELQAITVENCVSAQLDRILRAQLDESWGALSPRSKQLAADLKTLRHLANTLMMSDSVSFLATITPYRNMDYALNAAWVLQDSAEQLFLRAKSRVVTSKNEFLPEVNARWTALSEVLQVEVPTEAEKMKVDAPKILVLCQDASICFQLSQVLARGPYTHLYFMALKHGIKFSGISDRIRSKLKNLPTVRQVEESSDKKEPTSSSGVETDSGDPFEDEEMVRCSYVLTMTQKGEHFNISKPDQSMEETEGPFSFEAFEEMENMDLSALNQTDPVVLIQTFKNSNNVLALQKTLSELQPHFVVFYQYNITAIRQIEIYEARRGPTERRTKIYFLMHNETIEEQGYLTTLRREIEAFNHLIEKRETMVIPKYQDGKSDSTYLMRNEVVPEKSTRKGGRQSELLPDRPVVIVDMREFRSDLPSILHRDGIDINPVTLAVGDYILTPDICVERKSISDLIGSLNSGRLYQQCTAMERNFSRPMLLIEFESNRPFRWPDDGDARRKLQLLTLHFPRLKLIWSSGPYLTAKIFKELKQGRPQPNEPKTLAPVPDPFSTVTCDFLRRLPGITGKNIDMLLRKVANMTALVKLSEDEINDIIKNPSEAKLIHNIIHVKHEPKDTQNKNKGKTFKKFKYMKK